MDEEDKKICGTCSTIKLLTEFNKNSCKSDGLQTICIACSRAKSKAHYNANKKASRARNKKRIEENKRFILDYLSQNQCVDCGEKDIVVLDFDHLSDKRWNISEMTTSGFAIASIQKEISKCEVRCANCHRRKTAKEFGWYRLMRHENGGSTPSL